MSVIKVRSLSIALVLVLIGCLMSAAQPVVAQPVAAAASEAIPPALKPMVDAGFKIQRHFDAEHGLTGWVLAKNLNVIHIVYTTADGKAMLVGDLIDDHGTNQTEVSTSKFSGHPELEPLFAQLEKSRYIVTGTLERPRRIVYILFDANCPFCSAAYQGLRAYANMGVQMRWVPVAYLRPDSQARAAAILEASDPAAALKTNEEGFDKDKHAGGIAPLDHPSAASVAALDSNNALMDKLKVTATPGWIYRDDQGQIQRQMGLPEPMMMLQILGVPQP